VDEHNRGSTTGLRVAAPERGESWKVNHIPSVTRSAVVGDCLAVLEVLGPRKIVAADRTYILSRGSLDEATGSHGTSSVSNLSEQSVACRPSKQWLNAPLHPERRRGT